MAKIKEAKTEQIKTQISIKLDPEILDYFKKLSDELGIGYQTLINMYLDECVKTKKKPNIRIKWE